MNSNNTFTRMQKLAGIITENQEYYKDAEKDDAAHIDALEKDMKDDAKHTSEGKMTKSELKAKIKEMILAELNEDSDEDINITDADSAYDPLAENEPEEYEDDYDYSNDYYDANDDNYSDGYIDDYDTEYDLGIDEAKKDKDEEIKDITVDDTETIEDTTDMVDTGVSNDIPNIQSHLQSAYSEAKQLGDEKLITQIANTITYFTKAHVLDTAPINEQISPEAVDRMEGLANMRLLKMLHDSIRILGTEWMNEGFEKEDVKEYISNFIDNI